MWKQNKRLAKTKTQLDNLHAPIWVPTAGSATLLSSCTTLVSRSGSPAPSLFCLGSLTYLSSRPMPAFVSRSAAVLSSLLILGPTPPHLASTVLKIFKRALSDELLRGHSTSPAEPLCPFPPLGSLPNKTDCKQTFDTAFINSCLFAGNHSWEEFDLSFKEYGSSVAVKLNRSWQFELLDPELVCIMEAILLAAAIFWDPSFAPCHCHSVKLAFKLGLRTQSIVSGVVKQRVELVWANRTISQLDQLF